jgi:hypothetical protein
MIFFLILLSCKSSAEEFAIDWVREHSSKVAPIHSYWCSDKKDSDGRVACKVETEDHHRIFSFKLKCFDYPKLPKLGANCIEALDD